MDMHIHPAVLEASEKHALRQPGPQPEFFFSEQLSAHYDADSRAIWSRWTPSPRPSFNPRLLRDLDNYCRFVADTTGFVNCLGQRMPIEYTVLSSGVPGVFNLGGDLDLFLRLIDAGDRARAGRLRQGLHRRAVPQLHRARSADHHHLAGPGRVPGRRVRSGTVERHRDCGEACPLRLPRDPVQPVPRHGRLLLPRPPSRPPGDRRASFALVKPTRADDMLAMGVIDHVADWAAGEAEVAAVIKRQSRNRNGLLGIASVRRRVNGDQLPGIARRGAPVGRLRRLRLTSRRPEADAAAGVAAERHDGIEREVH